MKLIRLTSTNSDGHFNNDFYEDIILDKNSQIALQNASFEIDVNSITINGTNNTLIFQLSNGNIRTVKLTPGIYNNSNYNSLLNDIGAKLNSGLTNFGKELGSQWRCILEKSKKITAEYKTNQAIQDLNNWVLTNTSWIGVNNTTIGSSNGTPSTDRNVNYLSYNFPQCKGGCVFRSKIQTLVNNGASQTTNGFIVALLNKHPDSITGDIQNTDITYGVQVHRPTDPYHFFDNGVITASTELPNYFGVGNNNNDIMAISITQGRIRGEIYFNGGTSTTPKVLFNSTYDNVSDLYPVIIFRGDNVHSRATFIRVIADPFYSESVGIYEEAEVGTTPYPPQAVNFKSNSYLEYSPSLAEYLGYESNRIPNTGTFLSVSQTFTSENNFTGANYSDAFLVEMMNLSLNSYDGYTNQRQNYLCVIPASDDNSNDTVIYTPPYPLFIDIGNKEKMTLRTVRCRLLNNDRSPIRLKGLGTITILITNPMMSIN